MISFHMAAEQRCKLSRTPAGLNTSSLPKQLWPLAELVLSAPVDQALELPHVALVVFVTKLTPVPVMDGVLVPLHPLIVAERLVTPTETVEAIRTLPGEVVVVAEVDYPPVHLADCSRWLSNINPVTCATMFL